MDYPRHKVQMGDLFELSEVPIVITRRDRVTVANAAARALWKEATRALQSGRTRHASVMGSMAKNACTAIGMRAPVEAIQVLGATGLSKDVPLERFMRDAKAYQIYDGTTQIHNLIIGRYLDRDGLPFD